MLYFNFNLQFILFQTSSFFLNQFIYQLSEKGFDILECGILGGKKGIAQKTYGKF